MPDRFQQTGEMDWWQKLQLNMFPWQRVYPRVSEGEFVPWGVSPEGRWLPFRAGAPSAKSTKRATQVSPDELATMWKYWQSRPRLSQGKKAPEKPVTRPRIVSEQGYLFMVDTDKEGNEEWTPIGKAPAVVQGQEEYDKYLKLMGEIQERQARQIARSGSQMQDIRPLLEEAFEAGRTARVSGLTGYQDWIKRWDATHQVNPYTVPQSERVGQRISQLEGQPGGEAELARLREDAYGIAWAEQERFLREGARPTTPPTPEWLSEFVPGLKAGQPISRKSIPIPSGQQLTKMSPSQAQTLGGYAEWVGSPWQDILAQAQMMQPFTPNIASRWQPARQRR